MRHRLTTKVFDRGKGRNIPFDQKSRTSSTFTLSKNPHLTKHKLHSKSTYFYRWGSRLNYVIPSACTLALLVGGMIAINPVLNNVEQASAWTAASSDGSITLTIPDADMNQNATAAEPGKITDMQQMTSAICGNATIGMTDQLKDTRDNKLYWVTKLKDENCWMTQNLDFDVPAQISDTSSDVIGATVDTGTTKTVSLSNWSSSDNTYNSYYDLESYIYNGPDNNHSQGVSCSNNIGLKNCEQFSPVTADSDLHYHVGNMHSWNAATAGTGKGITSGQAPGSICPKGWQLPLSGNNTGSKSFVYLLTKYNVQNNSTGTVDGKNTAIYGKPLHFVYSGNLRSGSLRNAGDWAFYWSSTSANAGDAYNLYFGSSVLPS